MATKHRARTSGKSNERSKRQARDAGSSRCPQRKRTEMSEAERDVTTCLLTRGSGVLRRLIAFQQRHGDDFAKAVCAGASHDDAVVAYLYAAASFLECSFDSVRSTLPLKAQAELFSELAAMVYLSFSNDTLSPHRDWAVLSAVTPRAAAPAQPETHQGEPTGHDGSPLH